MNGRAMVAGAAMVALLAGCTGANPRLTRPAGTPPHPAPQAIVTAAPDSPFGPGADGIGDAYYPQAGNGGYDVASYDLDIRYDPATDRLTGTAVITAMATANLTRFDLDLKALAVDSVAIDGAAATSTTSGDELVVTPATRIGTGTTFVTTIRYGGVPKAYQEEDLGEVGFLHNGDGAVAIGEPEVAASWFPVNDHPRDKATYTVRITAPDGLTAMSNGVLKGKQSTAGWTTWSWAEDKPMAPYLATMVVGHYRVQQSTHNGLPVFLAVDTMLDPKIDTQVARTPEIVDFLASEFGPYPFDALGGVVIDDRRVRFALENQTRPIYSWSFFQSGEDGTWVLVHELAHQWYGDSVSISDWREIWLNEGFATFAEWLWTEKHGGQSTRATFDTYYDRASPDLWKVPPGDPGKAGLFGNSVYVRGGMALQALRVSVGDDAFFKIIRAWAAEKADGNGSTPEFVALAERISGRQLDQLFHDWLYGTIRPPRP